MRVARAIAFLLLVHLALASALSAAPLPIEHGSSSYRAAHSVEFIAAINVELERPIPVRAVSRTILPDVQVEQRAYVARSSLPPRPRFYALLLKRHVPRMSDPPS